MFGKVITWLFFIAVAVALPIIGVPILIVYFLYNIFSKKKPKTTPKIPEPEKSIYEKKGLYGLGIKGYMDTHFKQSADSGNVFINAIFPNKYVLRLYLEITGYGINGDKEEAYKCYCYDAKLSVDGNWASINELKGMDKAQNMVNKYSDKFLHKTVYITYKEFVKQ